MRMPEQQNRESVVGGVDALLEQAYGLRRDHAAALVLLEQAKALIDASGLDPAPTVCSFVEVALRIERGERVEQSEIEEAGHATVERPEWRMRYLRLKGLWHQGRSESEQALRDHGEALEIAMRLGHDAEIGGALMHIGNAYRKMGDAAAAAEYLQKALACFEQAGDEVSAARAMGNLAILHQELGNYRESESYITRSLEVFTRLGREADVTSGLIILGNVHLRLGNLDRALELYREALERRRGEKNPQGLSTALNNVGTALFTMKQYESAIAPFEECVALRREIGDLDALAGALANLGNAQREIGDIDAALVTHAEALELVRRTKVPITTQQVYRSISETEERAGNHAAAIGHLREHYRIERELTSAETQRRVHSIEVARKVELAGKEAEIERLRNVELAAAHRELQEAHERLKQAQAQLVHAEKMSSLGQLTAGIAHEINNPTNFVRSAVGPLRRDLLEVRTIYHEAADALPDDARRLFLEALDASERDEIAEEIERLLDGIEEGAGRIAAIVLGLRSFSRLDEDDLKPVDLHEGIDATLALLQTRIGAIDLRRHYGELPRVECNPGQINQVVMNLVANAIDACGGAGTITVSTSRDGDDHVRIEVVDTGAGIAPEHLPHLFEPFFTTKPVGSGQGLGLAISHGIVERHHGRIDVASAPGSGTRVTVTLPLRPPRM